jgi:hypothetical protein
MPLVASAVFLLLAVFAQSMPAGSAVQPQGDARVVLTLRFTDGRRQFRPGEIIPIELEFSSAAPKRFTVDGATYDRSGRLTIDDFVIDRMDDVSDPMLDYFGSIGGSIGGGLRGVGVLGEKPYTVKLELNEWFRFDKPGTYTLAVKSRRVTDESVTPHTLVPVESNPVSFEILPRSPAWEASQLESALRLVDAKPVGGRSGCRMMRFLGTDAAAMEMIRRYGADTERGCDFDYMAGLFGAENRASVVRAMEEGLRAPDQPVTGSYLRTLSALSVYLQHPEFRPAQTRGTKGRLIARGELTARPDLVDAAMTAYIGIVNAALPDKTDRARAITMVEAQTWPQRQPPARSAASRDQLAAAFLDLPVERQANLLEYQWSTVAGPAMLPALRRLADAPPTNDTPSIADLALRRLAQLAPDEARPLILREIRTPRRGATLKTLGSLQDVELPDLDDALAANLEASNTEIHAALVHRYATRRVAPRILAAAGDAIGRMACSQQSSIIAYFLRVDEPVGAALLDRAMASRTTGCWRNLEQIASLRMTPVVQARAIADLDNPDPDAVVGAVQTLGQHGSSAALEALLAAFERWHAAWSGRSAELVYSRAADAPNARQAMVEDAFRQAIGTGQGWLVREPELRKLQSLCVTDGCRTQTGYMIHGDDTRIMLWHINEPDESHIVLAQYRFTSIAALERMLPRYPRGTAFTLQRNANETTEVSAAIGRLIAFAASQGLTITQR